MTTDPAEQVFEELLPYLETLDAQIGAIVQALKDKGVITSEGFTKLVQKADMASDIRKRGLRVRMEFLFSSAAKRSTE